MKIKQALKKGSLRRYVFRVAMIHGLIVVLCYSLLLHWFFIRGLDESNYMYMTMEAQSFSKNYDAGLQPQVPRSIHFNGYLGWQQLPPWLQQQFSSLQQVTELQLRNLKLTNDSSTREQEELVVFMVAQPLKDGNTFYLVRRITLEDHSGQIRTRMIETVLLTWPLALAFLLTILASVYFTLSRLTRPMSALGNWSAALTLDDVSKSPPDFAFNELNTIAQQQQDAFCRLASILEKEQDFLRFSSHELRTPIAVIKSNTELLTRVLAGQKGSTSLERIQRAVLNMQHMTETLLWLSREQEEKVQGQALDLSEMLTTLSDDNHYLLQGKNVAVSFDCDHNIVEVAETPCRLILNNVIRNAFQYTAEGDIEISLSQGQVLITNVNRSQEDIDHHGADYGYGLGLMLVERIVAKMGWHYQNSEIPGGRKVSIAFLEVRV
ncbi:sensor histidine kinase [Thalassomonas actiniarum]|uniref:histidine kinase n=1 Tax=Thalassomonas actiniarum TaxID=485447 RepID=A0AAE9YJA9_9GAMM|nr:HAMP domain-containing sensor histidine kinase [Thalassomonas actiniarum]WDD96965.1 HAMP domain-containing histidine kinase [Thalassomonas actiniarum]